MNFKDFFFVSNAQAVTKKKKCSSLLFLYEM